MQERLELSLERIKEIKTEKKLQKKYQEYFETVAAFLLQIEENRQWVLAGNLFTASLEELEQRNRSLYQDVLPENYKAAKNCPLSRPNRSTAY